MTTPSDSSSLLDVAKRAALAVEPQLLATFRTPTEVECKRDFHDIVTPHDRAAEETIRKVIFDAVPDSTFVGEEGGSQGQGRVAWYVDPIDGTSNFARGIALWCISIAAAVDGRLVAGVILEPVARNIFAASLDGAWLNEHPIRAKAARHERDALLLTGVPNARHLGHFGREALDGQAELLNAFHAMRNLGSGALHLAHVAAGWADAAFSFSTNPWDIGAGALLVEQAGGHFAGFARGQPFEPAFLAPDYVAVGPGADYRTLDRVTHRLSALSSAGSAKDNAA